MRDDSIGRMTLAILLAKNCGTLDDEIRAKPKGAPLNLPGLDEDEAQQLGLLVDDALAKGPIKRTGKS